MPQWPWRNPRPGVDEYGRSSVWYNAAKGDAAALNADLQLGLSPTAADKDGCTSLHVAAQNGHADVVALLIQADADVNAADRHGNGPLWTACHEAGKRMATEANFSIVTLLLKAGADPHHANKVGRTPDVWRARNSAVDAAFASAGLSGG